ncbi:ComEA family DNA-binding protein [Paenibacillus woosongensis]|uniref:ComEA family DNA-binding protein n=1 Tax=Paenibacillus woosongensis TaxID=307580 RepID=A0AA95I8K2_9BACL|nr:ComEA family DNA-binding protein [Paenibacillus woosongensis]WHX47765.1 ComEA family DNA-binding protein [Paenibacillus woosongensis]
MKLKREYVMTAVVSAVLGAGLMLFAVGGSRPAGIEGWVPVNREVAAAMAGDSGQGGASAAAAQAEGAPAQAAAGQGNLAAGSSVAVPDSAGSPNPGPDGAGQAGVLEQSAAPAVPLASDSSAAAVPLQPSAEPSPQDGLVSINTANSSQLQTIPGIGEKKAQAIIDYRNQHGSFNSLSDLKKVKGIGEKVFQKLKPYIKL